MEKTPNFIVIVSDTLRTKYLGCYGSSTISTPNIDGLAADGVTFSRAYPESLPTIPARRALHTGRRAFPFGEYDPIPWDHVYLPGWQPMSSNEPTLAEGLASLGYQTGFYSDVPHYFVPGMNFHRGFHQFEFIRGQAEDQLNSIHNVDDRLLSSYEVRRSDRRVREHLANVRPHRAEEEWPTARTMRAAARFLEENAGKAPIYLYVDTFSPHESWEAPISYYRMYGNNADREPMALTVPYGPLAEHPEFRDRLPSIVANYAGLVTYVDAWVGHLLGSIRRLGLTNDTYVFFTSDHGTNFADNPEEIIGKPAQYLYPGTMHVPLIMRTPAGNDAGRTVDSLVYNTVDVPTTIASIVDDVLGSTGIAGEMNGRDLRDPDAAGRDYLTSRYGNSVFYVSNEYYYFAGVDFTAPRLFDLKIDPGCTVNVADSQADALRTIEQRILEDADGPLKAWVREGATDALGRPLFRSTPSTL